jgi:hypothetical protein
MMVLLALQLQVELMEPQHHLMFVQELHLGQVR